jgi:PncC family amidohydrolase
MGWVNSVPAADVVARLKERGQTVAVAESTAGGLVAAALIAVPGASAVTPGGLVAYSNTPKMDLLGVPRDVLRAHGAVSAECAAAMAEGARRAFSTDWGLAETGLAGPGGTPEKPAGTIFAAVAGPNGTVTRHWRFEGDRLSVMQQTADSLLALLAEQLPAAG